MVQGEIATNVFLVGIVAVVDVVAAVISRVFCVEDSIQIQVHHVVLCVARVVPDISLLLELEWMRHANSDRVVRKRAASIIVLGASVH